MGDYSLPTLPGYAIAYNRTLFYKFNFLKLKHICQLEVHG